MSLILDALNRSRQDSDRVPGLGTQHPVEKFAVEGRPYVRWMALAVALVLILISGLVWKRFSAPPAPAADIGAPVAELSRNIGSAVTSVTAELKARAAAVEVEPQESQPVPDTLSIPVPEQVPVPAVNEAALSPAAAPAPSLVPSSGSAADTAVAQLYEQRDVEETVPVEDQSAPAEKPSDIEQAGAASSEEPTVDIDKILQKAREELDNASLDAHPVPFLSSLSQHVKDEVPTLYYERHDYATDAAQSSVVLNGKKVTVGGSPASGLKVEEILSDSVVLNFRGTLFRLRALNSWINL